MKKAFKKPVFYNRDPLEYVPNSRNESRKKIEATYA